MPDLEGLLVDGCHCVVPPILGGLVGSCCTTQGVQPGALRQPRGVGQSFKREGHTYTYVDSCYCMAETNTTLQSNQKF